jgi:IS1 family transposase
LGYHIGTRGLEDFEKLYNQIEDINVKYYSSDYWKAYGLLSEDQHLWGKAHNYTVERTNRRLRHYLARLTRRTYCFSKSVEMLDASLTLFVYYKFLLYINF